ncbi:hypothetical protein [uncultured Desulfobacter sp.]|uniref:hypothetical protein n=1 Tax=uncultured Desulfobacter sp. TaxID=240139 RepID=UPI003747EADA
MRYAKGIAGADINITGPRKLGAALQAIKGLKGCFNFLGLFYMLCGIASSGRGAGAEWLAVPYY